MSGVLPDSRRALKCKRALKIQNFDLTIMRKGSVYLGRVKAGISDRVKEFSSLKGLQKIPYCTDVVLSYIILNLETPFSDCEHQN